MSLSPGYPLPPTSFDRIVKIYPELIEYVAKDIESRRNQGKPGSVIGSVDEITDNQFEMCLKHHVQKLVNHAAEASGLPSKQIAADLRSSPQYKTFLTSINQDYHNLLNFELAGRKTFYFSDNLTDHLLATELGIDAELVRLPFDACMFVFTANSAIDALHMLNEERPEPEACGKPVCVYMVSLPDDENPNCRKILMSGDQWLNSKNRNIGFKREISIRPGWSLNDALHTDWKALGESGSSLSTSEDATFYTDGLALFRLFLNAALYLGSNDPDIAQRLSGRDAAMKRADSVKSNAKAKKIRSEAKRESTLNYTSVGESIPPIFVTKRFSQTNHAPEIGFREFATRFLVRGHWRNQPCGPNMTERRLLWIKPYYKGPEMAELVNRPYIVA